jgi:hypothetical protein
MNSMYDDSSLRTIAELQTFLNNPVVIHITLKGTPEERAHWIFEHLRRFQYAHLKKKDKGVVLQYVQRVTGLSEKQLDRHIKAYKRGVSLCGAYQRCTEFKVQYGLLDAHLLAEVDNATGRLAGATTRVFLQEQYAA